MTRDAPPPGTWIDRGDTVIYDSEWVRLATADVLLPDGTRIDHHVVRMPGPAAGVVMVRDEAVLLLWRHRFITDTWGWEIPAGRVDAGETPAEAARREAEEESGWRPVAVEPLCTFNGANGILDQAFHIFVSTDAHQVGEPTDPNESTRVEWMAIRDARAAVLAGDVPDGLTFGALCFAFVAGVL